MELCFRPLLQLSKRQRLNYPTYPQWQQGYAIESSVKRRFDHVFDSKDAIIAALTVPKFKVKWVDSQEKKDAYKQMMMEELRTLESDITIEENSRSDESGNQQEKKTDFYEFNTDDEPEEDNLESEVADYFKNAKALIVWINIQKLGNCF